MPEDSSYQRLCKFIKERPEIGGDRSLWSPLNEEIKSLIQSDPRIRELFDLAIEADRVEYLFFPNGNIYMQCTPNVVASREAAQRYFGDEPPWNNGPPYSNRELLDHSMCLPTFVREFPDGVIQVAGFGRRWSSEPDKSWAIYGHIVSERRD